MPDLRAEVGPPYVYQRFPKMLHKPEGAYIRVGNEFEFGKAKADGWKERAYPPVVVPEPEPVLAVDAQLAAFLVRLNTLEDAVQTAASNLIELDIKLSDRLQKSEDAKPALALALDAKPAKAK